MQIIPRAFITYTYDAWGNILSTTDSMADTLGVKNPLRCRRYVYDQETGLYYVSSRYCDPEIGRWINADALVSTGQGLLGNNMFAYCGINPVRRRDESGLNWFEDSNIAVYPPVLFSAIFIGMVMKDMDYLNAIVALTRFSPS